MVIIFFSSNYVNIEREIIISSLVKNNIVKGKKCKQTIFVEVVWENETESERVESYVNSRNSDHLFLGFVPNFWRKFGTARCIWGFHIGSINFM